MSNSGALFDLDKLNDVSKMFWLKFRRKKFMIFAEMAKEYKKEIVNLLEEHKDSVINFCLWAEILKNRAKT